MKLLFCIMCRDAIKLAYTPRQCACGRSSGLYINPIHAEYSGPARIIGIANEDIQEALERPDHPALRCWLMREDAPHIRKADA